MCPSSVYASFASRIFGRSCRSVPYPHLPSNRPVTMNAGGFPGVMAAEPCLICALKSGGMAFVGDIGLDHIARHDLIHLRAFINVDFHFFAVVVLDPIVFTLRLH